MTSDFSKTQEICAYLLHKRQGDFLLLSEKDVCTKTQYHKVMNLKLALEQYSVSGENSAEFKFKIGEGQRSLAELIRHKKSDAVALRNDSFSNYDSTDSLEIQTLNDAADAALSIQSDLLAVMRALNIPTRNQSLKSK